MDAKDIKINNIDALGNFSSADTLQKYVQQVAQGLSNVINNGGGGRNVQVGETTTLAEGVDATVAESPLSTPETLVLDFGIPQGIQGLQGAKGDKGDAGVAGTNAVNPIFGIGTVTLGATANVTVTGTYPNLVLNFVLVKGDTGAQGPQGIQGIQGPAFVPADGSIVRAKLEAAVLDEIKYDQALITWTGSQTITNNVSFNIVSLLTNALITRNTIGLVLNEASDLFTLTPRNFDQNIRVLCRLTGTVGGASGTAREFFVELTRPGAAGALLIRDAVIKISDSNINSRQTTFETYVIGGTTDLFFTQGFEIKLNNISTQNVNLTGFTLLFFG